MAPTRPPLRLDITNCRRDRVGLAGFDAMEIEQATPWLRELTSRLEETRGTGWERWRNLPFDPARASHVAAVREIVGASGDIDTLIVLGIGGSALGNIALQAALNPVTWNLLPRDQRDGPRLFVIDNVDPRVVKQTLDFVRHVDPGLERTLVNVVSKSGETAETAAQFMVLRSLLMEARGDSYADHIVATTDPEKGTMRRICDAEGYRTLPVPDGVGGRFSVLSPVGLLSAAMCGIDIDALLDGAAAMDERCRSTTIAENPAALLAWTLIESYRRGRRNHVLMPYATQLLPLADWYRQLWAESLGKGVHIDGSIAYEGPTPIKALGTTDQHSQVQLYREGPDDKVIGFVAVDDMQDVVEIPAGLGEDALAYLEGKSLQTLLDAERAATAFALVESKRPNFTIHLPRIDAHAVGEFLQLWMVTTAYAGLMLGVNTYDQPAVETGKLATFGLMGRPGFEEWKARVDG